MLDQTQPWLDDPQVDHSGNPPAPVHVPRIPAQSGNVRGIDPATAPAPASSPSQPWANDRPDTQPQGDQSTTTGDAMQGGFADSQPDQPKSKLSPEDEAHYVELLHTGSLSDIVQFLSSKGYSTDNYDALNKFIYARDNRKANGGRVNYGISYEYPRPAPGDLPADLQPGAAQAAGRGVADDIPGIKHITAFTRTLDSKLGLAHPTNRSFGDEFNYQQDLGHGAEQGDKADHPWARVSGQLLGGLAVPTGLEGLGLQVGTDVLRAGGTMAEARAAVKVAIRNRMASVGGTYGALHGAGEAETPGGAVTGALTEGALGAVTGGALGQVAPTSTGAAGRVVPALTEGQQVGAAADRLGMEVLPADVGGPVTRRLTGAMTQTPFGAGAITEAAQGVTTQGQAIRDQVATTVGTVLNPEAAGETARAGARAYIANSGTAGGNMYRAAENAAQGARVSPTEALSVLDRNIRELSETPGGADGLARLQGLRDALGRGDFSVQGIRNMRTALRDDFTNAGLRGSDIERRVNQVVDAANQDVVTSLNNQGRQGAANLYARADRAWRERVQLIDQTIEPIIGTDAKPKSGEEIVAGLQRAMKGNNGRFVQFINSLPAEQQGSVRASLIGRLGRATKSAQNEQGNAFSLQTFLSNWDDIGDAAKHALFGAEGRAALNDLATVARGSRQAMRYANHSNTGGALEVNRLLTYVTALPTLGASVAGQYGMGRLLASPRFARWLARAPRTALSTPAYVDRLSRIARAEPAIANEVLQLQQRLASAFTGSSMPTRLAAQEPTNEADGGQGNAGEQQPQNQSLQP